MRMNLRWSVLVLAAVALPAAAQEMRDSIAPEKGVASTATVGNTVFQRDHYRALPAYILSERVTAKIIFARVDLPPDTALLPLKSKSKLKVCAAASLEAFRSKMFAGCLFDDDGDGRFDRVAGNEVQSGKALPHPVPYSKGEWVEPSPGSIKQVVIFLGSTKDILRLSYREFVNDMARPAFTEEYSFPLGTAFPQTVAFKDVKLSLTGIDGEGLHYSVLP